MASPLASSGLTLPVTLANKIWEKTQRGSIVGQLVGSEPMKFGTSKVMTFTKRPLAEYVAEGAQKTGSDVAFGVKTVDPHKVQVTTRYDQEVQWLDEDYQLGVLTEITAACGDALARALDLGVFHGINPITGTAAASITQTIAGAGGTTSTVDVAGKTDLEIEEALGNVLTADFVPNGIALDPKLAWTLATQRDTTGRKLYPELQMTVDPTSFSGLKTSVSNTVSGVPEAADTGVQGIVGDWSQLMWGIQRQVPIEKIEYGDPDGLGDLKRKNQIALRAEIVYGWAVMDASAFSLLKTAVSGG